MEDKNDIVDGASAESHSKGMSEETRGFVYAICSALCYTVSLTMLRGITDHPEVSPDWSIAVKELATVVCVSPFIVAQWIRGKYRFPAKEIVFALILAGIACEAVGARSHLQAYDALGLALATPLIQAAQLILSSLIGAFFLKERVTKMKCVALALLIVAVWLLSWGGGDAPISRRPTRLGFGLLCAFCTALGYATQLSIMRGVLRRKKTDATKESSASKNLYAPTSLVMVTITGIGVLVCGGALTCEEGLAGWTTAPPECWAFVLIAGIANMIGFFFQIEGLRRLFVLKQTMVANAQTISLTLVGVVFFREKFTLIVALGVAMVAAGVAIAGLEKQRSN